MILFHAEQMNLISCIGCENSAEVLMQVRSEILIQKNIYNTCALSSTTAFVSTVDSGILCL